MPNKPHIRYICSRNLTSDFRPWSPDITWPVHDRTKPTPAILFLGLVYPRKKFSMALGCISRKSIPHQIQPKYDDTHSDQKFSVETPMKRRRIKGVELNFREFLVRMRVIRFETHGKILRPNLNWFILCSISSVIFICGNYKIYCNK